MTDFKNNILKTQNDWTGFILRLTLAIVLLPHGAQKLLGMFGGYGFMEDYPLARMFRDARLGTIGGGTSEIMCEIIAKMVVDGKGYGVER